MRRDVTQLPTSDRTKREREGEDLDLVRRDRY